MKKSLNAEILLFIFSLPLYFLIAGTNVTHLNSVLFSSPDAVSYGQVSTWIFHKSMDNSNLIVRPFLYPLFLGLRFIFSNYSIWFFQAIMLFASAWLTFKSVYAYTGNKALAISGYLLLITNISLQLLTTHALTEVLSVFLISVWIFVFAKTKSADSRNGFVLLFLLSLLTVVKPVFIVGLLLYSGYFIGGLFRQKQMDLRKGGILVLCFAPVLIQIVLMKVYFNTWEVSKISSYTLKNYLVSRVYALDHNLPGDLVIANKTINTWNDSRLYSYVLGHLPLTIKTYARSVIGWNLLEKTNFSANTLALGISRLENYVYMVFHIAFGIGLVFVMKANSVKSAVKKHVFVLYVFSSVIILTSGISFWQGDRLVVTSLPLWITAYALIAAQLPNAYTGLIKKGRRAKSS